MKNFVLFTLALLTFCTAAEAQTAEEIIATYLETIGGEENMAKVRTAKYICSANSQGMDIPVMMYQKAPNLQRLDLEFQGQKITQMAFDGNEGWSTNFQTMQPEKYPAEDSDILKAQLDFPDPFIGYKAKGYAISKEADETIEGTDCHVIKLTRKPVIIEDKEEENAVYTYFDKETNVPIMSKDFALKGPQKGTAIETYTGDYQEVDGLYFAHSIRQVIEGQTIYQVTVNSIELNADLPADFFAMPVPVSDK
jgi:outer membrane lipoprotein-sorting protein